MVLETAGGGDRRPKHIEIDDAIDMLERQVNTFDNFINEINARPSTPYGSDEVDEQKPTLHAVLMHSGERIRSLAGRLESLTDEARELLF